MDIHTLEAVDLGGWLDLMLKTANSLSLLKVKTLFDLVALSPDTIENCFSCNRRLGLGSRQTWEIIQALEAKGLKLQMTREDLARLYPEHERYRVLV